MSFVSKKVVDKVIRVKNARSLDRAVKLAYISSGYAFQSNPWFVDVKDRFRIFEFENRQYIAKRSRSDKARDEVERSQRAYEYVDGKTIEGKTLRVVVPVIISCDEDRVYIVSEYTGSDLNQFSYEGISPQLTAKQYVRVVQFLSENGVAHPGFLPRNLVERGDEMFLFDWEDATFLLAGERIDFDRLWYTNFILNWSYLFPREDLELHIASILNGARLSEPPLVRYERTFKDIIHNEDTSLTDVRDVIEHVVFGAELPVKTQTHINALRPNDLGHLLADIFFVEMDVLGDMASKVVREHDEHLYNAINGVISRIIHLCRYDHIDGIQRYATVGILLLIDPHSYSESDYIDIIKKDSLSEIILSLKQKNQHSLATDFINGELRRERLSGALRLCVEDATGFSPTDDSGHIARITEYIATLQDEEK